MEFSQISLLLVLAASAGILVKKFRQPVLVGYIITGFLLSITGIVHDANLINDMGRVGVTLLLFLIGVEMNLRDIPVIGKNALIIGLGQIIVSFGLSMGLGMLLGFSIITATYIAIGMSFASTIIIIRLLSEKNSLGSLHGKLSVGILLIQDFVAIMVLLFLSGFKAGGINALGTVFIFAKGVILLSVTWFASKKLLPRFFDKFVADSQELLFIVSIAWALGFASLVAGPLGFTLEIGGFLAGLALSNLPEHLEIASRTRPLRDFFLTIFFLSLGANLILPGIGTIITPIFVFLIFVSIVNPLIIIVIMSLLKFKRRTSFLTAVNFTQISEFSLIVMSVGRSLGQIGKQEASIVVVVAAVSMTLSTYFIINAEDIYGKLKDKLRIFERKHPFEIESTNGRILIDHIVLIGCYRTGSAILKLLNNRNLPYLVVDFNPSVYQRLSAEKYNIIYGDISDPEILIETNIDKAKLVISTIDNMADNLRLLEYIKRFKKRPSTIFTSVTRSDALKLYEKGASYVIVPDIVAGEYLRHLIKSYGVGGGKFEKIGRNHYRKLIFT